MGSCVAGRVIGATLTCGGASSRFELLRDEPPASSLFPPISRRTSTTCDTSNMSTYADADPEFPAAAAEDTEMLQAPPPPPPAAREDFPAADSDDNPRPSNEQADPASARTCHES